MAKYQTLIDEINGYITTNGQGEIDGADLNKVLNDIVFSLGENYSFIGKVDPTSTFAGSEGNVFAFANTAGTYPNFGGISLASGELAFLTYNGTWNKITISELAQELGDRADVGVSQLLLKKTLDQIKNSQEEVSVPDYKDVVENGLFFVDVNGYVGVKIDQNGLHGINIIEI